MIAPNMATLLCYVITDAHVPAEHLERIFRKAAGATLNSITIDGDMSTNDTAIILSPARGEALAGPGDLSNFEEALHQVLQRLAEMLVHDAEGATKLVRIHVTGGASDEDAMKAARAVSQSLLVKTAFFGMDPNWGRIAAAAGYSGADVREESLTVKIEEMELLVKGTPAPFDPGAMKEIMSRRDFSVTVDLGLGSGNASMLTSDISYDYVKINAEYTT